jgi:hypothetical protein
MQQIKDFIKNNWIPIVLIAILLVLAIFNAVDNYSSNRAQKLVEQTQIREWKRQYEDSIKSSHFKERLLLLDSTKRADSIKTVFHAKRAAKLALIVKDQGQQIDKLQNKANNSVANYNKDTANHTVKCDSAIQALQTVNRSLYIQRDSLSSQCKELDQEAEEYSRQLYSCEKANKLGLEEIQSKENSFADSQKVNQQLRDQINKQNTWLKRNEKWIYMGVGILGTILIMR